MQLYLVIVEIKEFGDLQMAKHGKIFFHQIFLLAIAELRLVLVHQMKMLFILLLQKLLDMDSLAKLFLMEVHGLLFGNMNIFLEMVQEQEEFGQIFLVTYQIIVPHLIILMLKDLMIY